jgi:hypothetical protein
MYIGATILGATYVASWMVAGVGVVCGLVIHIIFNHDYNFPICT